MLKYTGIELDLISDGDMYKMIEKGKRGGVSTIMKRWAESNHKYLSDYDKKQISKFIEYLDANNLYGWAMSQKLPFRNFRWICQSELENWESMACILEVDLEYPKELHDLHNEYPLAPEKLLIGNVEKLVPNLNNKERYVLHYENLKLYLRLGLKITKIHRGITFEESDFMKKYIDLNTNMRKNAKSDSEKDFYKLANNAVYGKTMENVRNRVNVSLVTDVKKANKFYKKPHFKRDTHFSENLVAIHMEKTTVKLDKLIYIGVSILELSKTLMYEFHYDYIIPKYGEAVDLLFTDTDSLCYEIRTEDFYEDISGDVEKWFDTSNYDKNHPSGIPTGINKKVVGMYKDECGGKDIKEFCGLRSKLYAFVLDTG